VELIHRSASSASPPRAGGLVSLLVLVLRIAVGGLLMAAGALKVGHPQALAATIAAFRILPAFAVAPFALLLPIFEIGLGAYLVVGLYARVAAIIAAVEFVVFALAIASVVIRGIPIACGCFGQGDAAPASWLDVVRDFAFALLTIPIIMRGPGMLALDQRMSSPPASSNGAP
jgi:uncharacterized membrane protein YphA (DoxX/SURF4 family)